MVKVIFLIVMLGIFGNNGFSSPSKEAWVTECQSTTDSALRITYKAIKGSRTCDDAYEYLKSGSRFQFSHKNISDLRPFKKFTNIKSLILSHNRIRNIEPISRLKRLIKLDLSSNKLEDINWLSSLTTLESLNLSDNLLQSIDSLSYLKKLRKLSLNKNKLESRSLSALSDLVNLTGLNLSSNEIDDISELANLTRMGRLLINETMVSDLSPIEGMTQLRTLSAVNCEISALPSFKKLSQIETLYLGRNSIKDLGPLEDCVSLENLYISNNLIESVEPLAQLYELKDLDLKNNNISVIDALGHLSLCEVQLAGNKIDQFTPVANVDEVYGDGLQSDWPDVVALDRNESGIVEVAMPTNIKLLNKEIRFKRTYETPAVVTVKIPYRAIVNVPYYLNGYESGHKRVASRSHAIHTFNPAIHKISDATLLRTIVSRSSDGDGSSHHPQIIWERHLIETGHTFKIIELNFEQAKKLAAGETEYFKILIMCCPS